MNDKERIYAGRHTDTFLHSIGGMEMSAKIEAVKANALTAFTGLNPKEFDPNVVLFAAGVYQGAATIENGFKQIVEQGKKIERKQAEEECQNQQ